MTKKRILLVGASITGSVANFLRSSQAEENYDINALIYAATPASHIYGIMFQEWFPKIDLGAFPKPDLICTFESGVVECLANRIGRTPQPEYYASDGSPVYKHHPYGGLPWTPEWGLLSTQALRAQSNIRGIKFHYCAGGGTSWRIETDPLKQTLWQDVEDDWRQSVADQFALWVAGNGEDKVFYDEEWFKDRSEHLWIDPIHPSPEGAELLYKTAKSRWDKVLLEPQ